MDRETHGRPRKQAIKLQAAESGITHHHRDAIRKAQHQRWRVLGKKMCSLEFPNPWEVNASGQEITRECVASQDNGGSAGYGGIYPYFSEMLSNYIPVVMSVIYFRFQQKPTLLQLGQNVNNCYIRMASTQVFMILFVLVFCVLEVSQHKWKREVLEEKTF